MPRQIFVNLPIKDMQRSQAFWRSLGFDINPDFTNESGACLVIADNIFAMLLVEPFFAGFTDKRIVDATREVEVLNCLSCESREELEQLVQRAVAAGGTVRAPLKDHGFMVQHAFDDIDGHTWELVYMAPGQSPPRAG